MSRGANDRRPAKRYDIRAPVEFRADGCQGEGMIWDISLSGLRIEDATLVLAVGTHVGLSPSYYPGSNEIELWGEVVRATKTGFAVEFTTLGTSALELLKRILP